MYEDQTQNNDPEIYKEYLDSRYMIHPSYCCIIYSDSHVL